MKLLQLGHDVDSERDLYSLELNQLQEFPSNFRLPSKHFVCLTVGDTSHLSDRDLHGLADTLLRSGAVYLSFWGPGSNRAQALFDDAILMSDYESSNEAVIPTVAHDEELEETLNFLLLFTGAAPEYQDSCHAALVLLLSAPEHTAAVHRALEDPKAFVTAI
ncbi:MAG: hypothetical protein AAF387_01005 [Pseudomonadota bacterium]